MQKGPLTSGSVTHALGLFEACSYQVSKQTAVIDYDAIEQQVLELKPLILFTPTTSLGNQLTHQN